MQTRTPKEILIDDVQGLLYKNKTDEGDDGCWIEAQDFYQAATAIVDLTEQHYSQISKEQLSSCPRPADGIYAKDEASAAAIIIDATLKLSTEKGKAIVAHLISKGLGLEEGAAAQGEEDWIKVDEETEWPLNTEILLWNQRVKRYMVVKYDGVWLKTYDGGKAIGDITHYKILSQPLPPLPKS